MGAWGHGGMEAWGCGEVILAMLDEFLADEFGRSAVAEYFRKIPGRMFPVSAVGILYQIMPGIDD